MADDTNTQLNSDTDPAPVEEATPTVESSEPEASTGDVAKSETAEVIGEVESTPDSEASDDSASQQTNSEPETEPSTQSQTEASGTSQSDEPPAEPVIEDIEEIATEPSAPRNDEDIEPETITDKPVTEPVVDEPATLPADSGKNDNPNARWYVVHTYSGHENKVAVTLKQRIESEHLEEKILDVLVPMQDKIEIKSGKKVTIKEKIFPGYILVKMVLDDLSWLAVRTTQGVTSFVGMGNKPTPITEAEVQTIVKFTQNEAPVYKQVFASDDTVKIVDGPFSDFIGKVDSVDEERGKVKVLVSIFGRETPVELDFLQIQKI